LEEIKMRRLIISLIIIFLFTASLLAMNEVNNWKEIAAIKKAIMDYYHEGHVKSDPELYKKILHDEWKLFSFDGDGKLGIADKAEYLSWYNPQKVDQSLKWKTEFYYVDVTDKMGAVKLRIGNQKFGYIDYFNLMKIDGTWWIMHKISQSEK